ncbi:hypothetical protein PInf_006433 [Phytophthora infestans]|nr:hypothetical protein PInf_006257 [Phytophthora infestans]KAI9984889.1 hypothetical protein PInf_006433 [Phytophthora infestans]
MEATKVTSGTIDPSSDAAVSKRSGIEDEAGIIHDAPAGCMGEHTPALSELDYRVHALARDYGDHSPRTSVHSECPAVKAKGSPKAGDGEEEKPHLATCGTVSTRPTVG